MRLIFAGTPEFAAHALAALHAAGHEILLVLTQPDRPAGRGLKLAPSGVKALAQKLGIELDQPASLNDAQTQQRLRTLGADAMVVAAYGLILPEPVLTAARLGAINIHASLLPRWRGAAPIQRALLAGDAHTGISVMQMDRGLDTGPILDVESIPIAADDTSASLQQKLADLGARLIVSALARIERGELRAEPQPGEGACYAAKITKAEAEIDWREAAPVIERKIRAFDPFPGASTFARRTGLKLWRAGVSAAAGAAGTILESSPGGIVVACGSGALRVLELQRAGGKRLAAAQFLAGFPLAAGERLEFSGKDAI
ncbi:MAG: methionyl-tRNA formyltransferase [Betaproteobacteria bacterium]|nr:MAG: methionyl-tRNA formyltransferase [Betaproteobacteria bacterium]